jgi:hypothetical protein
MNLDKGIANELRSKIGDVGTGLADDEPADASTHSLDELDRKTPSAPTRVDGSESVRELLLNAWKNDFVVVCLCNTRVHLRVHSWDSNQPRPPGLLGWRPD